MTVKTWTTLGLGRETNPADLAAQRSHAGHIRRQTRTVGDRDRRISRRASRDRRRGSTDRASKPKPPPFARKAPRGAEV
jgi:hypothetical protein